MSQNFVVENIEFKMKTQAMLHFDPMMFTIKQPRRRDLALSETHFWSPEVHSLLGNHFITILDQDGLLRKIKVNQFLKEFARIEDALERDSNMIKDTFTVLQEGLSRVSFAEIMRMAYNKYAMQSKMRSRSNL